jgi:hypothetical protein
LNTQTGEVLGQTVPRHTSEAFVAFLGEIVASQPRGGEIHVILDNLSTHKTRAVTACLETHPQPKIFTPSSRTPDCTVMRLSAAIQISISRICLTSHVSVH